VQGLAVLSIILYPVGVILLCCMLLFKCRQTLLYSDGGTSSPYARSISFLHASFVPHYFYFDILEMMKKLLLVGFASLMSPGSLEQIVMAMILSMLFMILHLQSYPYRNQLDNVLATAVHLTLTMFFMWCTLLQTGALGDPEEASSLSASGSVISVVMMLSAVGVLVIAVSLFFMEMVMRKAAEMYEEKQRAKWAGCTIEPPATTWTSSKNKSYACFLSHYKVEAASDARFLHDMLAKMLRYPIFLDSAKLVDLRQLISNGIGDCDVVILLCTKGVLTRPWCLLEVVEAQRRKVPILLLEIKNSNWDMDAAFHYIQNLEDNMGRDDPDGLALIKEHFGGSLQDPVEVAKGMEELREGVKGLLDGGCSLTWNPNSSDMELIASLKDLIEAMANVTETPIKWKGMNKKSEDERREELAKLGQRSNSKLGLTKPALHILCAEEALNDARVLQTETAMGLGKVVSTTGAPIDVEDAEAVSVLLTKEVLNDPVILIQLFKAVVSEKMLVPICLIGRGYDYRAAPLHLADLAPGLGADKLDELTARLGNEVDAKGMPATVEALQVALTATLPRIIAVNWEPEAGKNQLDATVNNVLSRMKRAAAAVPALKLGSPNSTRQRIPGFRQRVQSADSARKACNTDRSDPSASSESLPSAKEGSKSLRRPSTSERCKSTDLCLPTDTTKRFGAKDEETGQGAEAVVVKVKVAASSADEFDKHDILMTWRADGKGENDGEREGGGGTKDAQQEVLPIPAVATAKAATPKSAAPFEGAEALSV